MILSPAARFGNDWVCLVPEKSGPSCTRQVRRDGDLYFISSPHPTEKFFTRDVSKIDSLHRIVWHEMGHIYDSMHIGAIMAVITGLL